MVYVSYVLLLQHSLTCVTFYQRGFGSRFLYSIVACDDAGALRAGLEDGLRREYRFGEGKAIGIIMSKLRVP